MKICFLARPSYDVYSTCLFIKLNDIANTNIDGIFITTNDKESAFVKRKLSGYNNIKIYETSSYLKKHWNEFTLEKLCMYEEKYDCKPIWKYIYTDRFLIKRDYDYCIHITVGLFQFFEEVFTSDKVDFYYSECIATLQCYIAFIVGKKTSVKYVSQMCARGVLDSTYHYFVADEFQHNDRFDQKYKSNSYSDNEWKLAEQILSRFESTDSPPPAMKLVKTKPRIDKEFLLSPLRYIYYRFDKNLNDPYSYMYFQSYKDSMNPIKFYFNYQKVKKYYHKADFEKKYVYYPLHYQPEASTCVCAEKYEKQLFFIDSLAKSLPADTVLYVKEHYARIGHRDPHFYIDMQQFPNVTIIDPWESSRKLIENSEAVATLTGTAGLEALLIRKPVILGGNTVFDNAPGIIKVQDIYDNYVSAIKNWIKPQREDIIQYLCVCLRSYGEGNAYAQNYSHLIADNIDNITRSLYGYLNEQMRIKNL